MPLRSPNSLPLLKMLARPVTGIVALVMCVVVRPGAEDGTLHALKAAPEDARKTSHWHRGAGNVRGGPTPVKNLPVNVKHSYCI